MTRLAPRAKQAMLFIQHYVARVGRAPTLQEIATGIGIVSKGAAHRILDELELAGHIARAKNARRGIALLRLLPDDRFEEAAKAVCAALGHTDSADITKARDAIVSSLIERNAA